MVKLRLIKGQTEAGGDKLPKLIMSQMDSLKQNINWLNFISNIKIKQDQKKNAPENIIHIL